ncbi:hypothetical protein ILUMI_06070, partial [Ignelater luminosus]
FRANAEIKKLGTFLRKNLEGIPEQASNLEVNWHFNPPHAPHFGGLLKAIVKFVKYHIRRIADDPDDLDLLTPARFQIGRLLVSVPDPDVSTVPGNRLTQFQTVQQILRHFWRRRYQEYLSGLQTRSKWLVILSS